MNSGSGSSHNFFSLSVRDLLEAREAYHVHLAHLDNVFATAIGRYFIRHGDEDHAAPAKTPIPQASRGRHAATSDQPRTLRNASVQDWSWPCVLVFVDQWRRRDDFRQDPDSMVPRFLYMPDGRVVPTCVIAVNRSDAPAQPAQPKNFPSDLCGGGYPVLTDVQGRQHLGSIGCMVTDGDMVYALTNRHVVGEAGREVYTLVNNAPQRLGVSDALQVGKLPFAEAYPGWPGGRLLANLDVGLLRVDDVNRWTAQVYGIGELGPLVDLNADTFGLDLIGRKVKAFGAASGEMRGQIAGLFYRYKSVGGLDYASDFVIAPREAGQALNNLPGNSGTLWVDDPEGDQSDLRAPSAKPVPRADRMPQRAPRLRPLALQWGGQVLTSPGSATLGHGTEFALATCLATICRQLDVEIITDWNIGHVEYWGTIGHYKIGALACERIKEAAFRNFMMTNQTSIAYDDQTLINGTPAHQRGDFVPLADVADIVWRFSRPDDANNHFADMDRPGEGRFNGQTLLDLTADGSNIDPDTWNDFYAALGDDKRGALPFRVWQIYDEAVDYLAAGDYTKFFCAIGVMAHYCGDACQPLHVSQYHHGLDPSDKNAARVHSIYETTMLADNVGELIADLAAGLANRPMVEGRIGSGAQAAKMICDLMHRTVATLPPLDIVNLFNSSSGRHRTHDLWEQLKTPTIAVMIDGAETLAMIWHSAWLTGRKKHRAGLAAAPHAAIPQGDLQQLYGDKNFCHSYKLDAVTLDANQRIVPRTGSETAVPSGGRARHKVAAAAASTAVRRGAVAGRPATKTATASRVNATKKARPTQKSAARAKAAARSQPGTKTARRKSPAKPKSPSR